MTLGEKLSDFSIRFSVRGYRMRRYFNWGEGGGGANDIHNV